MCKELNLADINPVTLFKPSAHFCYLGPIIGFSSHMTFFLVTDINNNQKLTYYNLFKSLNKMNTPDSNDLTDVPEKTDFILFFSLGLNKEEILSI